MDYQFKGTPGPWVAVAFTGHEKRAKEHKAFMGCIKSISPNCQEQEVYAGPFSFSSLQGRSAKEAQANAYLISAAPELLQACIKILNGFDNDIAPQPGAPIHAELRSTIHKALNIKQS